MDRAALTNLIEYTQYWTLDEHGIVCVVSIPYVLLTPTPHAGSSLHQRVTFDDLASVDPRLPEALRYSAISAFEVLDRLQLDRDVLFAQLAYLQDPLLLPTCGACHLESVTWDDERQSLCVKGLLYLLFSEIPVAAGQPPIPVDPFVAQADRAEVNVPFAWMDTAYPDWRIRYLTGTTLDLPAALLALHVFGRMPLASMGSLDLPGLLVE